MQTVYRLALCLGFLSAGATIVAPQDLTNGLVAYWPLDGDATDHTGLGNDGTVVGAHVVAGKVNQAFSFDGIDDEIVIGMSAPALASVTAGPHSYSAWILLAQAIAPYPHAAFVIDSFNPALGPYLGDQRGIRFGTSTAPASMAPVFKWVMDPYPPAGYNLRASVELPLAEWHHVAGVFDGSEGRIYVDGVLAGSMLATGTGTGTTGWKIGNVSAGGTGLGFFPGLIDEVRVYGRALTEAELLILARGLSAEAGTNRAVDEGTLAVELDGSQSGGEDLRFHWEQIAGSPIVTLADPTAAVTSFDAPYVGANTTLTFQLTVTDNSRTATDTVDVSIVSVNEPPVSDAGDAFSIKEGATAKLNATSSYDPNSGDPLYYDWIQLSGPPTQLANPTSPTPAFTVPIAAGHTLVFELVVSDGHEASPPATVQVRIVPNAPPTAYAGENQTKQEGAAVTLDGLASLDADGDGLSYDWQQVSGGVVELSSRAAATVNFKAPLVSAGGEQLVFRLVVTDDDPVNPLRSQPADVTVTVVNTNDPPRCDLGRPSESTLWPPSHKMTALAVEGVNDPDSESADVVLAIAGITQDEPVGNLENGDASPDAVISDDGQSVLIRSERAGSGNGRVYRIVFTASDGSESCQGAVEVAVPRSRKDPAQDDGQQYNSTQP